MTDTRKQSPTADSPRSREHWGLCLIGAVKLFKGILLFIVAIGVLELMHKDMALCVAEWVTLLKIDPDNHLIHGIVIKLISVDARTLEEIGVGTFVYALLLLTEGIGLLLQKRWAEYFTVIVTGSFIPLEIYELALRVHPAKIAILVFNVLVVVYLIMLLCRESRKHKRA